MPEGTDCVFGSRMGGKLAIGQRRAAVLAWVCWKKHRKVTAWLWVL